VTMDDDWWLDRLSQGFISYPQYSGKVLVEYVSANPLVLFTLDMAEEQ